jgi:hypothetical protein
MITKRNEIELAGKLGVLEMDEATIDREAMGRLAKALAFVCGADHPTTVALNTAAESGAERDIKNARTLFLRLRQSDRRAALAMLEDLAPITNLA